MHHCGAKLKRHNRTVGTEALFCEVMYAVKTRNANSRISQFLTCLYRMRSISRLSNEPHFCCGNCCSNTIGFQLFLLLLFLLLFLFLILTSSNKNVAFPTLSLSMMINDVTVKHMFCFLPHTYVLL